MSDSSRESDDQSAAGTKTDSSRARSPGPPSAPGPRGGGGCVPETDRLVVVATPVPLPDRFDRARWPVHVTVVPNFVVDGAAAAAVTSLARDAASHHPEFTVGLGPLERFGPSRDVLVLLAGHPTFHAMHTAIAGSVSALPAFRPDSGEFWGPGYRPHATVVSASGAPRSRHITITNLAVATLGDDEVRALANFRLHADTALGKVRSPVSPER